jgi:hypothetical protein
VAPAGDDDHDDHISVDSVGRHRKENIISYSDDDDHAETVTRFVFNATITGTQKGTWAVNWTAIINAPENSNADNDVQSATTQVVVNNSLRERFRELYTKMLELK